MPKVTFSNAKGILQEAGTGFQVNDAPILMESESVAGGASITVTPDVADGGDGDSAIDITGKYFRIATPDERFYVWFDGGSADTTDPTPADLAVANSIRLSESPAQLNTLVKVCNAITARLTTANNATGLDYSDTVADGDTTICTAVLGPADTDEVPDGAADTAGLGADAVGTKFAVTDDGSVVTIEVLPVGSIDGSLGDTLHTSEGDLRNLGTGEDGLDDDWTVTYTDGTGDNGSAVQAFGTSVIGNTGSETCTCTLANAPAGAKKLVIQSGVGIIAMSYSDHAGVSKTATFNADAEALYLLSTGLGWGVLKNEGSVGIA